jgi:hypothetical protein
MHGFYMSIKKSTAPVAPIDCKLPAFSSTKMLTPLVLLASLLLGQVLAAD